MADLSRDRSRPAGDSDARGPGDRRQPLSREDARRRSTIPRRLRRTPLAMTQPGPLSGRAAIITGASQGLGLEIAKAYVRAGASVLLCARDAARLDAARTDVAAVA